MTAAAELATTLNNVAYHADLLPVQDNGVQHGTVTALGGEVGTMTQNPMTHPDGAWFATTGTRLDHTVLRDHHGKTAFFATAQEALEAIAAANITLDDPITDQGGYLPCGCDASQPDHTCGPSA